MPVRRAVPPRPYSAYVATGCSGGRSPFASTHGRSDGSHHYAYVSRITEGPTGNQPWDFAGMGRCMVRPDTSASRGVLAATGAGLGFKVTNRSATSTLAVG